MCRRACLSAARTSHHVLARRRTARPAPARAAISRLLRTSGRRDLCPTKAGDVIDRAAKSVHRAVDVVRHDVTEVANAHDTPLQPRLAVGDRTPQSSCII